MLADSAKHAFSADTMLARYRLASAAASGQRTAENLPVWRWAGSPIQRLRVDALNMLHKDVVQVAAELALDLALE